MLGAWSAEERLRLVDRLSTCSSFTLIADRFLEPVSSALRASSAVFLEMSERPGQGIGIGRRSYIGARPWSVDVYADGYYRTDPLITPCLDVLYSGQGFDSPFVGTLPPPETWHNSDYYQRFLRPCDISHILGVMVPFRGTLGRQLLCLGFHRRSGDEPFGAADTQLLQQLTPLISSVLTGLAARDALPVSGALFERYTHANPRTGYVVFDEDLMVLHAGGGAPTHYSLARPGGVSAVEVEAQAVQSEAGPRYVATTSVAERTRAPLDAQQRFGFTSRENEVARLVCAGHSNTEIARVLGISLRTVENHLRAIYAKARVSSRTQLAARMLL